MTKSIGFTAPTGEILTITLEEGMTTFKIGYSETGAFTLNEVNDIVDCLQQILKM